MKDYYAILGISPTADDAAIKSAYRKLAKEYHPDTNKAPGAEAKFKEINEAHDILKDATKRAQYDAMLNPRAGARFEEFKPNWNTQQQNYHDLDEILRDLKMRRNPYQAQDARNRDITLSYQITLEEAYMGKDCNIRYNTADGKTHDFTFKVPEGINDGTRLRFVGKGDDALKHVGPGDLYVRVGIIPSTTFVRMGNHLHTSVMIDYLDALLGAEVEVPTIEGSKIKMKIPEGIQPGQSLRAKNKGMPIGHGHRGDMLVEVVIQPTKLNDEQRKLIEEARTKRT